MKNLATIFRDRFVEILPMSASYYSLAEGGAALKLEASLLQLNFAHLSPYAEFGVQYRRSGEDLMLWFYPAAEHRALLLPEAYLLYLGARRRSASGIFLFLGETARILVLEEGRLLNAFCIERADALQKRMLQEQYGLGEIFEYDAAAHREMLEGELAGLGMAALLQWYRAERKPAEVLREQAEALLLPISAAMILLVAAEWGHDRYLEREYDALTERYTEVKTQNDPYRREQKSRDAAAQFSSDFTEYALAYPNGFEVLAQISRALEATESVATGFRLTGAKLQLYVDTPHSVELLQLGLKSGLFEEFKIVSTNTIRNSDKERVHYEATLKALQEAS